MLTLILTKLFPCFTSERTFILAHILSKLLLIEVENSHLISLLFVVLYSDGFITELCRRTTIFAIVCYNTRYYLNVYIFLYFFFRKRKRDVMIGVTGRLCLNRNLQWNQIPLFQRNFVKLDKNLTMLTLNRVTVYQFLSRPQWITPIFKSNADSISKDIRQSGCQHVKYF